MEGSLWRAHSNDGAGAPMRLPRQAACPHTAASSFWLVAESQTLSGRACAAHAARAGATSALVGPI